MATPQLPSHPSLPAPPPPCVPCPARSYHGPKPTPGPNRIWVSNHTSMIDYVVLCSYSPFAVIMQLHSGWIAFLQKRCLSSLGCLWFNRCAF
jgi:hypothetical protein